MPGWQLEQIGKKLALEIFVYIIYETPLVSLFLQLFYSLIFNNSPRQKVSFN